MVLSMLSAVHSVKLRQSSESLSAVPAPHPQADPAAKVSHALDMSRRKQRNPKPLFTTNDESTDEPSTNVSASSVANDSDLDDLDHSDDPSSLVKVEVEEGFSPIADAHNGRSPAPSPDEQHHGTSGGLLPPPPPLLRPPEMFPAEPPHMFHFGDVAVNHHPDSAPVPMVVPMVYLYPYPGQEPGGIHKIKYRMFIPMGAPVEPLPSGFPHLSMPQLHDSSHHPRSNAKRKSDSSATIPLDLRKSPGSHFTDGHVDEDPNLISPGRNSTRSPSESGRGSIEALKKKEIEAQLQFFKAKQLEFLQSQQKQATLAAAAAKSNRCEECDINFSKYQNYLAHKKYYCSASAKSAPPPVVATVSKSDDEEPGPTRKASVKEEATSEPASTPPLPYPTPKSHPTTSSGLASPNSETSKELKLVKQQDLMAEQAQQLMIPRIPTNHFVCEGCGIKFKSVSNLQAHQARYCAKLRKSEEQTMLEAAMLKSQQKQARVSPPQLPLPLMAAEMMNFLNVKSLEQQLTVAAAAQAALAKEKPAGMVSPDGPQPGTSSAEDFCCILCGYKEQSLERLKDHINLHFISQMKRFQPVPTSPREPERSESNGSASTNGSGHDDGAPVSKRIKVEKSSVSPGRGEDPIETNSSKNDEK